MGNFPIAFEVFNKYLGLILKCSMRNLERYKDTVSCMGYSSLSFIFTLTMKNLSLVLYGF
jgi:hypothetical protein